MNWEKTRGRSPIDGRKRQDEAICEPENSGDVHATRAADIHEERVGRLDESLLLVFLGLSGGIGVQQVVLNEL